MGRPSKLTPDVQDRIVQAISAGNYYEAAAAYAGVDERTFYRWMELGEKARSGKYWQFCHAVKEAEAAAEVRTVAMWQKHMPNNWQAARDFLARRHPERWMPKEGRDITTGGSAINFIIEKDDGEDGQPDTPPSEAA